jgi:hypothetical protein
MRTIVRKYAGSRLNPQPWPWGDDLRVLVEHADAAERLRLASALREAGYAVTVCPGPAEGARCPLVAGEGCAAAHGADVIVSALPQDRAEAAEVRPMLRVRCAETPLIDASTMAPQHVVAAVRDALSGKRTPRPRPGTTGPRWNPFRSERDAFRLVLATAVAFAAVAIAGALGGLWPGLAVWLFATLVAASLYMRHLRRGRVLPTAPPHPPATAHYRVLIAAQTTPNAAALAEQIRARATGRPVSVHVVSLPHVSSLRRWTSDVDRPAGHAAALLERTLKGLRDAGLKATGSVGDDDPLQALEDALRSFPAEELVLVGDPGRDASALDALAGGVRARFALPTQVVATR